MRTTVAVQGLKCEDCRPQVIRAFETFEGISNVVTNVAIGNLSFDFTSHNVLEGLRRHLLEIGHPITKQYGIINDQPKMF